MVIRFTKATRFLCVCVMLAVTALISISTKSISVSAPYNARSKPLPVVVYRGIEDGSPTALSLRELRDDLAFLAGSGRAALSEQALVSALRREASLPGEPLLLLFDDSAKRFRSKIQPLLEEQGLPWFSLEKAALLSQELRAAGCPVVRLERRAGFTLEEQLRIHS